MLSELEKLKKAYEVYKKDLQTDKLIIDVKIKETTNFLDDIQTLIDRAKNTK